VGDGDRHEDQVFTPENAIIWGAIALVHAIMRSNAVMSHAIPRKGAKA